MTTCNYNAEMKAVGIRELKSRLSEYVRLASSGEVILVTDRGVVVAELRQPYTPMNTELPYPGLVELVRKGKARLGLPNDPELYTRRTVQTEAGTAIRLLDQERGDR